MVAVAGRHRLRTTYLSQLLGGGPPRRAWVLALLPGPRLLAWSFGLLAVAALVVGGIVAHDALWDADPPWLLPRPGR